MPTTGLISSPWSGTTVASPVTVKVDYTSTVNFALACSVGTAAEPSQSHQVPPNSATHTSAGIASGGGVFTVSAGALDSQPNVTVTTGTVPVVIGTGSGILPLKPTRKRKRRPISGETIATATYVVCLVYETDSSVPSRTIIAVGAAMVRKVGNKYRWSVQINFKTKKPNNFQYVAFVSAYDQHAAFIGASSQQLKK